MTTVPLAGDATLLFYMSDEAHEGRNAFVEKRAPRFGRGLHRVFLLARAEVIGEEAGDVSKTFRAAHKELDWDALIGMRHRLVHDYVRIRWERVWKLLQVDLPALVVKLERLIPPDPDDAAPR